MAEQHSQTADYENRWKFTGHELDRETGLYYAGARYYDPKVSIWLSVDPFFEKHPEFSPFIYCAQNPILFFDPDGRDWILATGDKIYWYGGKFGDKTELKHTFKSSSGLSDAKTDQGKMNLQKSKYQVVKNGGPTVEGKYKINLIPDPDRVAKADNKGNLLRNPEGGIEKIESIPVEDKPGYVYTYEDWGNNRARLEPVSVMQPKDEYGREYKRDLNSFYFHDSEKGYSSGCHEVEKSFFEVLNNYRNDGNTEIFVQVKYPNKEHITNGGTKSEN